MFNCATLFSSVLALFILLSQPAFSQDWIKPYKTAEQQIQSGNYKGAINTLRPHVSRHEQLISTYYYAHRAANSLKVFESEIKPLADSDAPRAAYYLATTYMSDGLIFKNNKNDVIKYYEKSLDGGYLFAAEKLASIYYQGNIQGMGKFDALHLRDYKKALEYFSICSGDSTIGEDCLQGIGHSLMKLGKTNNAIKYFEKARAYPALWALYNFGYSGLTKNTSNSLNYLNLMSKEIKTHPDKSFPDSREILKYYDGLIGGDASATMKIASMFRNDYPYGVVANDQLLVRLLKLSASLGSPAACEWIGILYSEGKRTRKDYVLSYAYYSLGLEFNPNEYQRTRTMRAISELELLMTKGDISQAQKIVRNYISKGSN